jgi:hypothetical protein
MRPGGALQPRPFHLPIGVLSIALLPIELQEL